MFLWYQFSSVSSTAFLFLWSVSLFVYRSRNLSGTRIHDSASYFPTLRHQCHLMSHAPPLVSRDQGAESPLSRLCVSPMISSDHNLIVCPQTPTISQKYFKQTNTDHDTDHDQPSSESAAENKHNDLTTVWLIPTYFHRLYRHWRPIICCKRGYYVCRHCSTALQNEHYKLWSTLLECIC